ncbi:MAG: thiamine phosphate synthase [Bacteroides sp.]|nr:thiamine phosphate synthase [Bacteroides sp.]
MKLIVITKEWFFPEEANWINQLMNECKFILHIRKPFSSELETEHLLLQIDQALYPRIVLHDHYTLAEKYHLKGIHLNARNLGCSNESEYCKSCSISRSCHSIPEVEKWKDSFDYVTLSPIFDSISKQGYKAAFTASELKQAIEKGIVDEKVIALGGITSSNITQIVNMGFGGAAVLGSIWNQSDITSALEELSYFYF